MTVPENQYYYGTSGCPAEDSSKDNCTCWHTAGTGPFPNALPNDGTHHLKWRRPSGIEQDRAAFEAWATDWIEGDCPDLRDTLLERTGDIYAHFMMRAYWRAWQAATFAERERAAKACEDYAADRWKLYKGRPPYTGKEAGRADPYTEGCSDGADACADKIRSGK